MVMAMNKDEFSIDYEWENYPDMIKEIGCTSANIKISIQENIATSNINKDSKTIKDHVYLSLYPFALWLARSWWRLIYENSIPARESEQYIFWRMAHDLTNAGEGFVWPDLEFSSDGKEMQVCNYKTVYNFASINYINPFQTTISLQKFIAISKQLIESVHDRLDAFNIHNTELHELWSTIIKENQNDNLKQQRIWEARLGFDPEDADPQLIKFIMKKAHEIGNDSLCEIISGFDTINNLAITSALSKLAQRLENGLTGKFQLPEIAPLSPGKPWDMGYAMAAHIRTECNLGEDNISDEKLADLLGLNEESLFSASDARDMSVASVGNADTAKFSFQRGTRAARRFIAARIIADKLQTHHNNIWLSATSSGTFRQKIQRAFAGELLCPINSLKNFIGTNNINIELLDEAAEYFNVNTLVPVLQLYNNHLLPVELRETLIPLDRDTSFRRVA